MNLFARFAAAFKRFTSRDLTATAENPELTIDDVNAMEASATEMEELRTTVATLKDEANTHATRITELETNVETANAATAPLVAALTENGVQLAEGADVVALAVEKINAWGKQGGKPAAAVSTSADEVNGNTNPYHTSVDDEVAAMREKAGYKKK